MTEGNYIYLSFLWVVFCSMHSLFASVYVKKIIAQWSGKYFTYYRPLYSVCSFIFLIFLLQYQAEKKETTLFSVSRAVQIVSAFLILAGLVIMCISALRYFIPVTGLAAFIKHKTGDNLLESGVHRIVRHPLYAGTLLFIWGLFMFFPLTGNLIACIIITLYIFVGIKLEEKKLLQQFGEAYRRYHHRVPMIIPKLIFQKTKYQIVLKRISALAQSLFKTVK